MDSWVCIFVLLRRLTPLILVYRGGYVEGGGADHRYNLSFIVKNSVQAGIPIIGVSINYRLAGNFLPHFSLAFTDLVSQAGDSYSLKNSRTRVREIWVSEINGECVVMEKQ